MFRNRYSADALLSGVTGWGNVGPVIGMEPRDNYTQWKFHAEDIYLSSHYLTTSDSAVPEAVIYVSDQDGHVTWDAGNLLGASFENIKVDNSSDDPCLLFLGGGTGDESDAANGSGRWVDDIRHNLRFENIELNHLGGGTPYAWCLGNAHSAENAGDERIGDIWASEGGLPSWQGIKVRCLDLYDTGGPPQTSGTPDGLCDGDATSPAELLIPDHPQATVAMDDTEDCGALAYGATVEIHDAPTLNKCLDSDADGQMSDETEGSPPNEYYATCLCDPAGNGATGRWSSGSTSEYWSAWAFTVDETNCVDPTGVQINSGPRVGAVVCADNDSSTFDVDMKLPGGYVDGTTMAVTLDLAQTVASTQDVDIDVKAMCRSSDDAINSTWGTEIPVGNAGTGSDGIVLTAANDLLQATSGALTPNGSCVADDHLFLTFGVDATGSGADVATTNLLGVTLEFERVLTD
jgi:hypothetical protein